MSIKSHTHTHTHIDMAVMNKTFASEQLMGTFVSEQLMGRHTDGISRTSNVHAASPKISKQLQQAVGLSLPPVSGTRASSPRPVCVFITAGPSTKLFTWGGWDMGGHVLRETTSRGLCGLVCP
jgi:hypothetical protein